ncbi:MAG: hypothetical protein RL648_1628 [Verrucomicrobiota bacterium]|jgi:dephospho-CoA kinase
MGIQIGLTGGMGCGKSTALAIFKRLGARVVETDALVKTLLRNDAGLKAEIGAAFGGEILDAEGNIDREALGRRVFADSRDLRVLESLVHPRVRDLWMAHLRETHPLLVVEIPLLFENGLETHFTQTICVSCTPSVQKKRLMARGMTAAEISNRTKRQLPTEEKVRRATITLHNNGSVEHLEEQIKWALASIRQSWPTEERDLLNT